MIRIASLAAVAACVLYVTPFTVQAADEVYREQPQTITGTSLSEVPYRVVQIADLNLLHPAGMQTLQGRIKAAVRSVCGEAQARELRLSKAVNKCREAAFDDAMAQVDDAIASIKVAAR